MHCLRNITMACVILFGLATCLEGKEKKPAPAIKEIELKLSGADAKKLRAKSSIKDPLVLEDAKTAAEYFSKDELKALADQFSFADQKLLVFAWGGSGRDQLTYVVMESFPEQIAFQYKRGMTKDLRYHLKVFVLRKNVRFRAPK